MKPQKRSGYSDDYSEYCERTLVTLLRRLGPWKKGIYLVGGLVPMYLIGPSGEEEEREGYLGTQDVDIVLDVAIFGEIDAYKRLEQNLKDAGFKRVTKRADDDEITPEHWRWSREVAPNMNVVVDILQDAEPDEGGRVGPVPNERRLSALGIPGAHLAIQDYVTVTLRAELLDEGGVTEETIRVANIVPFVALKTLAYDDRGQLIHRCGLTFSLDQGERQLIPAYCPPLSGQVRLLASAICWASGSAWRAITASCTPVRTWSGV
jgi:hypothetical protein